MSQKGNKLRLKGHFIFFATNNVNKFNEARQVLAEHEIAVGMLRVKSLEIQSERLEEIAEVSVVDAFGKCHLPLIVEDAGLFVDSLNGFPGPFAAYAYKTIGNQGLLKLMQNVKERSAHFESIVSYFSKDLKSPIFFGGKVQGEIAKEQKRGKINFGFGFDPIFRPIDANETFAEMSISEKNKFSHRARAFRAFAQWYKHKE